MCSIKLVTLLMTAMSLVQAAPTAANKTFTLKVYESTFGPIVGSIASISVPSGDDYTAISFFPSNSLPKGYKFIDWQFTNQTTQQGTMSPVNLGSGLNGHDAAASTAFLPNGGTESLVDFPNYNEKSEGLLLCKKGQANRLNCHTTTIKGGDSSLSGFMICNPSDGVYQLALGNDNPNFCQTAVIQLVYDG